MNKNNGKHIKVKDECNNLKDKNMFAIKYLYLLYYIAKEIEVLLQQDRK